MRLRTNVEPAAALLTLKRDAADMSTDPNDGPVSVLGVQRPAEIVNYRTMGTTPALLGIGLAAGAASALGLTLIASVRRRRRDLALLKTLGFTRRQLAAVVIWQASVAADHRHRRRRTARDHRGPRTMEPVCRGDPCGPKHERARRLNRPRRPRCALPRQPRRRHPRTPSRPHPKRATAPRRLSTQDPMPNLLSPPRRPARIDYATKRRGSIPITRRTSPEPCHLSAVLGQATIASRGTRVRADPAHYSRRHDFVTAL